MFFKEIHEPKTSKNIPIRSVHFFCRGCSAVPGAQAIQQTQPLDKGTPHALEDLKLVDGRIFTPTNHGKDDRILQICV